MKKTAKKRKKSKINREKESQRNRANFSSLIAEVAK
jgi:hypothetical protein